MAKCQQVPVNMYKCLLHALLYTGGGQEDEEREAEEEDEEEE